MTTHTIQYKDENGNVIGTDIITVPKRAQLKEILILQQALIEDMYQHIDPIGASCVYSGSLLLDDVIWNNLEKLAELIPVVGKATPGVDLGKLENDTPQLIKLFFTQSCDDAGNIPLSPDTLFLPSVISELYKFNYPKFLREMLRKAQQTEATTNNQ